MADVRETVERLWPGRAATFEVLGGRMTNHNVRVSFDDGEIVVVRVRLPGDELLGVDREAEHEASLRAAAVGVGPEVMAFVDDALVTKWIEGDVMTFDDMRLPENVRRVGRTLRAVHAGPPIRRRFSSFRIVEDYRTAAFSRGIDVPSEYAVARQIARRIERARGAAPERLCHNDLLTANFVDGGDRLRIVDWEYAGMGDVFFDLADFAAKHDLDREARQLLLESYRGTLRPDDERALELMLYMSDFREAMWALVQGAVSELDFDFAGRAAERFDRLARRAADPAFLAALGEA